MIVFADNDILYKLGAWNLLPLLTEAMDAKREDIRVLDTLHYRLRKPKSLLSRYGEDMVKRVVKYIEDLPPLTINERDDSLPIYPNQIDAGERTLLSSASTISDGLFFVATGDKRMINALPHVAGYELVCERVRGRIVCVEQILWLGIRRYDCEYIREQIKRCPACDGSVGNIFGSRMDLPADQIEEGFLSTLTDLQKNCGGLLHSFADLPSF